MWACSGFLPSTRTRIGDFFDELRLLLPGGAFRNLNVDDGMVLFLGNANLCD
jgi:hypothetical protein